MIKLRSWNCAEPNSPPSSPVKTDSHLHSHSHSPSTASIKLEPTMPLSSAPQSPVNDPLPLGYSHDGIPPGGWIPDPDPDVNLDLSESKPDVTSSKTSTSHSPSSPANTDHNALAKSRGVVARVVTRESIGLPNGISKSAIPSSGISINSLLSFGQNPGVDRHLLRMMHDDAIKKGLSLTAHKSGSLLGHSKSLLSITESSAGSKHSTADANTHSDAIASNNVVSHSPTSSPSSNNAPSNHVPASPTSTHSAPASPTESNVGYTTRLWGTMSDMFQRATSVAPYGMN